MSDRLDRLKNHATALEEQMADATGSAYAALSARYMECLKQIDEVASMPSSKTPEGTVLSEFEKRRAERQAAGQGRSAR